MFQSVPGKANVRVLIERVKDIRRSGRGEVNGALTEDVDPEVKVEMLT